jgi:hypothetical protein
MHPVAVVCLKKKYYVAAASSSLAGSGAVKMFILLKIVHFINHIKRVGAGAV